MKHNRKSKLGVAKWSCLYGLEFLAWLIIQYILMGPSVMNGFIADADTPIKLLEGYQKQEYYYGMVTVIGSVIHILCGILAFVLQAKDWISPKYRDEIDKWKPVNVSGRRYGLLGIIPVLMGFGFFPFMIFQNNNPFEQCEIFKQEIATIEEGKLETAVVHFSSDPYQRDMTTLGNVNKTMYYAGSGYQVKNGKVTEYKIESWTKFYVPNYMDFTLDIEHMYNEQKSIQWNDEYATTYRITYTPNLKLITSIEIEHRGSELIEGVTDRYINYISTFTENCYCEIGNIIEDGWEEMTYHIEQRDGSEMHFRINAMDSVHNYWERQQGIDNVFHLHSNEDEHRLIAATFHYADLKGANLFEWSKEEWLQLARDTCPYVENGYFDTRFSFEKEGTFIKVIYEVESMGKRGYDCIIISPEKEIFWTVTYFEQSDIFDEERALEIIKSVEYVDN